MFILIRSGVEEVIADVKNDMIILKGKGVNPKSLAERLENKCKKHVHIIYPELDNVCNDVKINEAPAIIDEVLYTFSIFLFILLFLA